MAIEAAALVTLNTFTNYVNNLAGAAIDFPIISVELPA